MKKISDGAQNFACYLIDKCEGETITEESILRWLGKMADEPQYNPSASIADTAGAKTVSAGQEQSLEAKVMEGFDVSKLKHEDGCRWWQDETFCTCGADQAELCRRWKSHALYWKNVASEYERMWAEESRQLLIANGCCERLMTACTDAGCPDGVRMDDWIRANAAPPARSVADAVREKIARALHYPDCWDTAAYPTLDTAILESMSNFICSTCLDNLVGSTGAPSVADAAGASDVHIATVYEDNDGTKHVQLDVENFDDLPVGMKLYARYENEL